MRDIRPSPIAGTWYPGSAEALAQSVDRLLRQAQPASLFPEGGGRSRAIIGVIVPHAGHTYSGLVAAHAFRLLQGLTPGVVAVVSPFHDPCPGRVLTTGHAVYGTPLGPVPVHQALLERFQEALGAAGLDLGRVRCDEEHSLEIELPFLQRVLRSSFSLLPVMLAEQSVEVAEAMGRALAQALAGTDSLLVGSSDLSHFYPEAIARRLDAEVLARLAAFDPAGVVAAEEEGVGFACGRGAIAAVLWAARDLGADRVRVLHRASSGDVTGDYTSVVGYAAAVIYRGDGRGQVQPAGGPPNA
jgi:AmmeMemoRadiSam system protein B